MAKIKLELRPKLWGQSGGNNPKLILHPERGAVFGPHLAPVVEPCRGDVRVAEPFLDLGDIGLVHERVRSRCGPQ